MEGEFLRRVDSALSGTIYEQLRELVRDTREAMETIAASQDASLGYQEKLDEKVAEIGGHLTTECNRLGTEFALRTDTLRASIEALAELTTEIGARVESIEQTLGRTRYERSA